MHVHFQGNAAAASHQPCKLRKKHYTKALQKTRAWAKYDTVCTACGYMYSCASLKLHAALTHRTGFSDVANILHEVRCGGSAGFQQVFDKFSDQLSLRPQLAEQPSEVAMKVL